MARNTEAPLDSLSLERQIELLGPWFHNLHLPSGLQTAPEHRLGDFPRRVWQRIAPRLPEHLGSWTALDIGCNAGFYAFELARRGASVVAIDHDPHYLRQAQWAARQFGLQDRIQFRQMQVYDLARHRQAYDLVWFMGVFYHLRYPLLGLDIVARCVQRLLVFQTMTMPGDAILDPPENFALDERGRMLQNGWPVMAFIEHRLADDPTNWWAANRACVEAMLRSASLQVTDFLPPEIYFCQPQQNGGRRASHLMEAEFMAATGQSQHAPGDNGISFAT